MVAAYVDEPDKSKDEFVKRAAFALMASLAGHDKDAPDRKFLDALHDFERSASRAKARQEAWR